MDVSANMHTNGHFLEFGILFSSLEIWGYRLIDSDISIYTKRT